VSAPHRHQAAPSFVFRAQRPTTDFLGASAGAMTFARRRLVAGGAQPAEPVGGIAGSRLQGDERARFVTPLFRAVRTIATPGKAYVRVHISNHHETLVLLTSAASRQCHQSFVGGVAVLAEKSANVRRWIMRPTLLVPLVVLCVGFSSA